jgi:hypothetical protein
LVAAAAAPANEDADAGNGERGRQKAHVFTLGPFSTGRHHGLREQAAPFMTRGLLRGVESFR